MADLPWGKAKPRNSIPYGWILVAAMGGAAAGNYLWSNSSNLANAVSAFVSSAGCDIKGNISIDTGERIYHVPGLTTDAYGHLFPRADDATELANAEAALLQ
ncbi:hypothetical protein EOC93_16120 [Mesorhizobium sp. M6A.T.Ce.TU.002.03.1.1]|uniref:hypothetical protein n=1 Tax=unclassified Mesorhizobium TaxID=325217 RepID=UPI000FCA686D|nr:MULTISPECIES: hypothetical protein [unclassified Mesorhizobium]RUU43089.1 hypothetical protein EOC93_16120 [Mesorhizobium sp. M6A.T.Ce.TU.002.03.1.1]RUU98471.1 hypothetical protein EOB36_23695 [Mesorhizobium sp. M6A.T.Cr.TU.017.01.1.1]